MVCGEDYEDIGSGPGNGSVGRFVAAEPRQAGDGAWPLQHKQDEGVRHGREYSNVSQRWKEYGLDDGMHSAGLGINCCIRLSWDGMGWITGLLWDSGVRSAEFYDWVIDSTPL